MLAILASRACANQSRPSIKEVLKRYLPAPHGDHPVATILTTHPPHRTAAVSLCSQSLSPYRTPAKSPWRFSGSSADPSCPTARDNPEGIRRKATLPAHVQSETEDDRSGIAHSACGRHRISYLKRAPRRGLRQTNRTASQDYKSCQPG